MDGWIAAKLFFDAGERLGDVNLPDGHKSPPGNAASACGGGTLQPACTRLQRTIGAVAIRGFSAAGGPPQRDPVRHPITGPLPIQLDKNFQGINQGPAAATQTLESAFKFLGNPSRFRCSHQA